MGVLVKVMPRDDFFHRRRYEITNGPPLRNPLSDFRRRNVDRTANGAIGRIGRDSTAIEDGELDQLFQIFESMPGAQPRQIIRADEVNEILPGVVANEIFDRVDGVRGRRTVQFAVVDDEATFPFDRSL